MCDMKEELIIRQLEEDDIEKGYLEIFDKERKPVSILEAKEIFKKTNSSPFHKIFIAIINSEIIGSITLIIEPKFIRNGGLIGHIEDVEIKNNYQRRGVGKKLLKKVLEFAENQGCYKTILDCSDDLMPFYLNSGFKHQTFLGKNVMRYNHENRN